MKSLMKHLVLRYGQEQMNSWRMELWWDERVTHDTENQKRYLQMFQDTYRIVKSYCPLLEVGGYGMRGNYRTDNLIEIWKSEPIKPDFISASLYAYIRGEENQDRFSKRNTDTNALKNVVTAMRAYMNELGMQDTKLYVTEWNLTISDRNYINDTCFKGAYIIKNYLDFYGIVDMAAYFVGSDRISEYYDTNGLLYGGTGILSKDGILKPAGFAFEFLNRLYPYYIGKGSNYIVSSNGHDIYGILCHNMRRLNYNYYFSKENELEKEQMWKYVEDRKQMEFKLTLSDIEPGEYQQKIYRINSKNGNIFKIWREMGFIDELDREDIEYLRRICEPKILIEEIVVTDCDIEVNIIIEPNEIVFVRLRKIG
jgi:beta-xylosidase